MKTIFFGVGHYNLNLRLFFRFTNFNDIDCFEDPVEFYTRLKGYKCNYLDFYNEILILRI